MKLKETLKVYDKVQLKFRYRSSNNKYKHNQSYENVTGITIRCFTYTKKILMEVTMFLFTMYLKSRNGEHEWTIKEQKRLF